MAKLHRYLGLFFGVQFLFWTISGIYFSWSNLDEVHGDFERRTPPPLTMAATWANPTLILRELKKDAPLPVESLKLVNFLGHPLYQVDIESKVLLIDALTGKIRPPLNQEEAVLLAKSHFVQDVPVKRVEYLTTTSKHHEYRKNPLPAYAITFDHPNQTTVYVAAEQAVVQKFRNRPWRIFDFLWMLHTMDYSSRDDINNWLLKFFSALGFITILSGFGLYGWKCYKPRRSLYTENKSS